MIFLRSLILLTFIATCLNARSQEMIPDSSWRIPDNLAETSGLSLFGMNLLSHNDSSHPNLLIEMNRKGGFVRTLTVEQSKNVDWEELCSDSKGNYFLGDFGNNINKRQNLCVYILNPFESKVIAEKIEFSFSDQKHFPPAESNRNFDCEAMFWMDNNLYLFSKDNSKPYSGYTKLYRLSDQPGERTAELLDSMLLGKGGYLEHSVTGAAFDRKNKRMILLTYQHIYIFYDFEGADFFKGKLMQFSMGGLRQREAICFDEEGNFFTTEEKRMGIGGMLNFYSLLPWFKGEKMYDRKEVMDVLGRKKENAIQFSFRCNQPGLYSVEIRGGSSGEFQLLTQTEVKQKENEGKEVLFGKIALPENYDSGTAVLCIYQNSTLVYSRKLSAFNK